MMWLRLGAMNMDKVYEITYLNQRVSNLFMITVGVIVLFVTDNLPIIENLLVRIIYNIIFVLIIIIISSRISNIIFKKMEL